MKFKRYKKKGKRVEENNEELKLKENTKKQERKKT